MKIKDSVRTLIVKTNPYQPFSTLNKMPYYLALKAFVQLCKGFREIKSIYLRHGLVEGNWVPGISDIDLTLVTDSKLTLEEEFLFLRTFWKCTDFLKKLFPMLKDIEILNEAHIETWTKFNIRGYESKNWRLIYGIETAKGNYVANPARLAVDSLNHGIRIYIDHILRRFYQEEPPSFMALQEMWRVSFKTLRYTNYLDVEPGKQKVNGLLENKTDMLCYVLGELEKRLRHFVPGFNPAGLRKDDKGWPADIDPHNNVFFDNQALDIRALAPWNEVIESIILNYRKRTFIVLKDGLDASVMKGCVDAVKRAFVQEDTIPVIVSPCVFKYMLRYYRPFEYSNFVRHRMVAYGKDFVSDVRPPDEYSLINFLIGQAPKLLTIPQRRTLISPTSPNWFLGRDFDSKVERFFLLRFYLEKGLIKVWYDELLSECERHYPDDFEKFRELKKGAGNLGVEVLSRETFKLLKGIANDIHKSISNSNVVDNLFKMDESVDK